MNKINISKKNDSPKIEITVHVRDKNGNPTGQTKTFGSEESLDISVWYEKQNPRKRKKKKKKSKKDADK